MIETKLINIYKSMGNYDFSIILLQRMAYFYLEFHLFSTNASYFDIPGLHKNSLETFVSHRLHQKPAGNSLEKLFVLTL